MSVATKQTCRHWRNRPRKVLVAQPLDSPSFQPLPQQSEWTVPTIQTSVLEEDLVSNLFYSFQVASYNLELGTPKLTVAFCRVHPDAKALRLSPSVPLRVAFRSLSLLCHRGTDFLPFRSWEPNVFAQRYICKQRKNEGALAPWFLSAVQCHPGCALTLS